MPTASPGFDADLSTGDLTPTSGFITSTAFTLQRLQRRIATHLGEALTNRFAGIDWQGWAQTMPPDLPMMIGFLRFQCDTCPGIARTQEATGDFNVRTGVATFRMQVVLAETGQTASLTVGIGGANGNPALLMLLLQPAPMFT